MANVRPLVLSATGAPQQIQTGQALVDAGGIAYLTSGDVIAPPPGGSDDAVTARLNLVLLI